MDERDLFVIASCISEDYNKLGVMDPNLIRAGSITIRRGSCPAHYQMIHEIYPPIREEAPEIIDYSVKSRGNQYREAAAFPNAPPQPAPRPAGAPYPSRKRPRHFPMDPMEQAFMTAEHERWDAMRARDYDRRNFWSMNDEDAAFFNSVLPHVRALNPRQKLNFRISILQTLDEGVPENDDPTPEPPSNPQQEVAGLYCGNCGQKFTFNQN